MSSFKLRSFVREGANFLITLNLSLIYLNISLSLFSFHHVRALWDAAAAAAATTIIILVELR
jgi:hypothetical protein